MFKGLLSVCISTHLSLNKLTSFQRGQKSDAWGNRQPSLPGRLLSVLTPNQLGRGGCCGTGSVQSICPTKMTQELIAWFPELSFLGTAADQTCGTEILVDYSNMPKKNMAPKYKQISARWESFKDRSLCHAIWHFLIMPVSLVFWSQP